MRFSNFSKAFLLVLVATLISACETVKVTTDHAAIDFSGFSTFRWLSDTISEENGNTNDLLDQRIRSDVNATLASKPYTQVAGGQGEVDFLVNYSVTTENKIDVKTYNTYSGYYPGYAWRGGGRYGYYDPFYSQPSTEQVVTEYKEGTMVLDIIDPKTQKLIWRGIGEKRLTGNASKVERDEIVSEVVSKILAQFPPAK